MTSSLKSIQEKVDEKCVEYKELMDIALKVRKKLIDDARDQSDSVCAEEVKTLLENLNEISASMNNLSNWLYDENNEVNEDLVKDAESQLKMFKVLCLHLLNTQNRMAQEISNWSKNINLKKEETATLYEKLEESIESYTRVFNMHMVNLINPGHIVSNAKDKSVET